MPQPKNVYMQVEFSPPGLNGIPRCFKQYQIVLERFVMFVLFPSSWYPQYHYHLLVVPTLSSLVNLPHYSIKVSNLATLQYQSIQPRKVNSSKFTTITKWLKEFKCNFPVFELFNHDLLFN